MRSKSTPWISVLPARPSAPAIVRADCVYDSGEHVTAPATKVSVVGAFVVTMILPPIGAVLAMRLHLPEHGPQSPFQARVVGVRIDPGNAMRTGFEVIFMDVDDQTLCRLGTLEEREAEPSAPERRAYPGVATQLRAEIRIGKEMAVAELRNLSMSGARLEFPEGLCNIELPSTLTLVLGGPLLGEELSLVATVIWQSYEQSRKSAGIHFAAVSPEAFRTLEEVLLYSLIGAVLPKVPRGGESA